MWETVPSIFKVSFSDLHNSRWLSFVHSNIIVQSKIQSPMCTLKTGLVWSLCKSPQQAILTSWSKTNPTRFHTIANTNSVKPRGLWFSIRSKQARQLLVGMRQVKRRSQYLIQACYISYWHLVWISSSDPFISQWGRLCLMTASWLRLDKKNAKWQQAPKAWARSSRALFPGQSGLYGDHFWSGFKSHEVSHLHQN